MKKIVPFKKEIPLNNNIHEILSISLEHTLHHELDYLITGEFIITGEYRMTDISINTEVFNFNIPFDINIDEKYKVDNVVIDIDDFYYEIINSNTLLINIEVLLDKLEEKEEVLEMPIVYDNKEEVINIQTEETEPIVIPCEEPIIVEEKKEQKIVEIKEYVTYKIYIVKEEDTVDVILKKYNLNREVLEEYNDLNDLKVGDKIIIPTNE